MQQILDEKFIRGNASDAIVIRYEWVIIIKKEAAGLSGLGLVQILIRDQAIYLAA